MNIQKRIEQLEQTINKAQSELEELKQETSKPKPMFERGDEGEAYHIIDEEYDVVDSIDTGVPLDDIRFKIANYYLEKDEHIAERVAKYYKDNNWFIRKAIEFADGYEWVKGGDNWCVYINQYNYGLDAHQSTKVQTQIYMTRENALKFKAWLEEYKSLK